MRFRWVAALVCAMMLVAALATVRAQDKPADAKKPDPAKVKLVLPWSKLSSLSDDQKARIHDIHAKANDDIKVIKDKETADITALLTDAQKAEVKAMEDKDAADKKTKAAAKKEEGAAAKEEKKAAE